MPGSVHVIGLGVPPGSGLSEEARTALTQAEIIIGAKRQLAVVSELHAETYPYPPLDNLAEFLEQHDNKRIVILASGDPLFYGIGAWLRGHLEADQLVFHPNISSIQVAFARIKRSWQQAEVVSLHGRSLLSLRARLQNNRLYALLTDQHSPPQAIASELKQADLAHSLLWVAEALGMKEERVRHFTVEELINIASKFHPVNVVIVETRGPGGVLPEFPGIPDAHFATDSGPGKGLLSKREVRVNILSLLQPRAGETGWDIGAGCGGVAVEWARWNPYGTVIAIEPNEERLTCLRLNQERFGVIQNLHTVAGRAPAILAELPDPEAVFIGGSGGELATILETAWSRLKPGSRLVASAVTETSRSLLYAFAANKTAEWVEIAVSRGESLAGQLLLRPQLPVLLMKVVK